MEVIELSSADLIDDLAQLLPQLEACDSDPEISVIHELCRTKVRLLRIGASVEFHVMPDEGDKEMYLMETIIIRLGEYEKILYFANEFGIRMNCLIYSAAKDRVRRWTEIIREKLAEQAIGPASASELQG